MANKLFTQEELSKIMAFRLQKERDRLDRVFESTLKRCMAAVHMTLHQEMLGMKRDLAAETEDTLLSAPVPVNTTARPCQPGTNHDAEGVKINV